MNSSSGSAAELQRDAEGIVRKLAACRKKILEEAETGRSIAREEEEGRADIDWRAWTQVLPPVAFEIARETKELVRVVDGIEGGDDDDFA